jgi:hypothetical protein
MILAKSIGAQRQVRKSRDAREQMQEGKQSHTACNNKPNYSTVPPEVAPASLFDAAPRAASLNAQVSQGGSWKSNRYSRTWCGK